MNTRFRRIAAVAAIGGASLVFRTEERAARAAPTPGATHANAPPSATPPLELTVFGTDVPKERGEFSLSADGKRSYFPVGSTYYVFDEDGALLKRMTTKSTVARTLVPLENGQFISAQTHALGQIALLDADGTQLRTLVKRGPTPENLRADSTAWTSPTGLAFDPAHQQLFALDTTSPQAGLPDPNWSRIAVFDANGKYVREIAAYDDSKLPVSDERRTWYDDIAVDPARSVVYVTARAARQLWAFDYTGATRGRVPGVAGVAVLPSGNVAVGDPDGKHVRIYDSSLRLVRTLEADGVVDLEADATGRLYASTKDSSLLYLRWPASLAAPTAIQPNFRHISVEIPFETVRAGETVSLRASVTGHPSPRDGDWQAYLRPSDGRELTWKPLEAKYADGSLLVRMPASHRGSYDLAVRYGKGFLSRADGQRDLHVQKTIHFEAVTGEVIALESLAGRSAFRRGEAIPLRIDDSGASPNATATLTRAPGGTVLASTRISLATHFWELPATLTARLLPGHYALNLAADARRGSYEFDVAESEPRSPMQRILYHEFDQAPATVGQFKLLDTTERMAFVRDYVADVAQLGFTRETDRAALKLDPTTAGVWSAFDEPTQDRVPRAGPWEAEWYLDRATSFGLRYDTQVLGHCATVLLADTSLAPVTSKLQRLTQWLGKYPSFYGFNYNDELFYPGAAASASKPSADRAWLDAKISEFRGHPLADAYLASLARMYAQFDRAITEVRPDLARTATPMWQYPAVEGSYAPKIYEHMTESYSHYLSEVYGWPWSPAHSAEILRRPGLPLMAVFDDGYEMGDGESYFKDALQVLGRGVQGFGVEHERPLVEARAANALRVMNEIGESYGALLAEAEPRNEAAVLYSYTQDVSEQRDALGTPHWERVLALFGAGLMAGLPMNITYEEDVAAGALIERGKPRVKRLFLVGQTTELPDPVQRALAAFTRAGGQISIDADSHARPGAERFPHTLVAPARPINQVFDNDTLFPDRQPAYEALATALKQELGDRRDFPIDTDRPWVAKNHFDGGAIQYVLIAAETGPYPWDAATVWSLGARYNKSYWPQRVELSVPPAQTIYDVFERRPVAAKIAGKRALIDADLRTFPGRLYALAPRALEAPRVSATATTASIALSVNVGLKARVPLRIVLEDGHGSSTTLFRCTGLDGSFEHALARPAGPGPFRLEVSELLGGKTSALSVSELALSDSWLNPLPDVETEREPQIRALATGPLQVLGADALTSEARATLTAALAQRGARVTFADALPKTPTPRTYVILATTSDPKATGQLLELANRQGIFGRKLDAAYPAKGRGFVGAAFAPRVTGENALAIVGGDARGLELAVKRFSVVLRGAAPASAVAEPSAAGATRLVASPAGVTTMPKLSERVGARLSAIVAWHGKLAVAANGYSGNLARIDDEGDHGRLVAALRVGESPRTTSLFLSNDGSLFGLAARTTRRLGETFQLADTRTPTRQEFASFGDAAPFQHIFSASGDGTSVLAPGPYGVVAWRRSGESWAEAWAVDYWKHFDALDWPVATDETRVPSFDTWVPRNGSVGLIAFGEVRNENWLSPQTLSRAELSAHALKDGATLWRFPVPVAGVPVFPKIYGNHDGSLVLLQAQLGTTTTESFAFYALEHGRLVGTWTAENAPVSVDVSDESRRTAIAYGAGSRLLEVRQEDGSVLFGTTWHAQPLALAFAEDGASVFVSDDAGMLSRVDAHGAVVWQTQLGCSAELTRTDSRLYAAGWDGRVRAFGLDGQAQWALDLTGSLEELSLTGSSTQSSIVHEATRHPTASSTVPKGRNLLRSGEAKLTVGGTPGWKSAGAVAIEPSALTNGATDDDVAPWIPTYDVYPDATEWRKVWVEIAFPRPTRVSSLTVYENPRFPDSWPTESVIQVWDEATRRWRTAKHGLFLRGAVATYSLELERVTKLRYVPWSSYFRNFHTSEIELR